MSGDDVKSATGATLAFLWLACLFVATLTVAIITLSASQLQNRLQVLSSSDRAITVWHVERLRKAWDVQQALISRQQEQLELRLNALSDLQTELTRLEAELDVVQAACTRTAIALRYKLSLFEPRATPEEAEMLRYALAEQRERFNGLVDGLEGDLRPNTWSEVQTLHAAFVTAVDQHADVEADLRRIRFSAANASLESERLQAILRTAQDDLDLILDPEKVMKDAEKAQLNDLISEFRFIEGFALGTLHKFSILPSDFLIIILVIAMGVLGSTMQLTYDYYRGENIGSPSLFMLRPMLGAISALVVFILLRAGVLVVTDSSTMTNSVPLNPFFIAFVGIVSGLLSENAMETVRRVGSTWFTTSAPDNNARWAVGVAGLLSETKTIDDLAARTGVDEDDLKAWVEQKKPTPEAAQRMFAAWLDKDVQTLFTDMPPREATT